MKVRIAGIAHESVVDGPGIRTTVFFQGCLHACPGCHNPQTWRLDGGREYQVDELLNQLKLTPLISGVTFSGGEPFLQAKAAAALGAAIKKRGLNLWVYSGFVWEDLLAKVDQPGYRKLIGLADVIVDGPYRQEERRLSVPFRGSSNQRLILVKEALETGKIVEWQPQRVAI